MFNVNIILLTYRNNQMARNVVSLCCEISQKLPGVIFSLGYGGEDTHYYKEYKSLTTVSNGCGGNTRFLANPDLTARLKFCLDQASEWTIFLNDDDPFSYNLVEALIISTKEHNSSTSMITPSMYVVHNAGGNNNIFRPNIESDELQTRYLQLLSSGHIGILYYATAHRSCSVNYWLKYLLKQKFTPSYSDQLLVTLGVFSGEVVRTTDLTFFSYNMENWATIEDSIASDAKTYPLPEFVLFHELFWCVDMYKLLRETGRFGEIWPLHLKWWETMLNSLTMLFAKRLSVVSVSQSDKAHFFLKKIIEYKSHFQKTFCIEQADLIWRTLSLLSDDIKKEIMKE